MQLESEEIDGSVTRVRLVGAPDLAGAEEIGLKLSVLADSRRCLLIELEQFTFLSSMGIRSLLSAAKTLARRGGKLILINPTPTVQKVLLTTGCDGLMPIVPTLDEALGLLAV